MGEILSTQLDAVTSILLKAAASAALLSLVVCGLVNLWGIIDPRMGQQVKGALLKIALTMALFAVAAGGSAVMRLA